MPRRALALPRLTIRKRPDDLVTARRAYLGGTDIAGILGVSPHRTRFEVWASKLGLTADDMSEEAEAGIYMEPYVLRRFATRYNLKLDTAPRTYRLRERPYLAVNPDAIVIPNRALVDAKTRSPFKRHEWGESGSGNVPPDELCQMQWGMELLDLPVAYLAVLFDRRLEVFVLDRDRELGQMMLAEATIFWNRFVIPRREPPFEGPAAADYLRRKHPMALHPHRPADDTETALVEAREILARRIDGAQRQLEAVEGELKNRIGDHAGLLGRGFRATWFEREGALRPDWKAIVTELRSWPITENEETARQFRAAIDAAIDRHTVKGSPTRTLRITFSGPRALPSEDVKLAAALPPKENHNGPSHA